ncbi:MAG: biotin--[Lentisphaeria bacterium]|nr:biotin--[acetyl-CoA-carboxylase] ligase [Lentisphaeria bacterium]
MIPGKITFFDEIDSTNTFVKTYINEIDDGELIVAFSQTAGRGRRGREWLSPANTNIYATMCIKQVDSAYLCGSIIALAALETLRYFYPEGDFYIKWPNDIYCGTAKIAGMLCDGCGVRDGKISAIAAGIGININFEVSEMNKIGQSATSLYALSNRKFNLKKVAKKLDFFAKQCYIIYLKDSAALRRAWEKENALIGKRIGIVKPDGETVYGIFESIRDDGALQMRTDSGKTECFFAGDVSVSKESLVNL